MPGWVTPQEACTVSCVHCPDVVEWCPGAGCESLLAYGTYELDEAAGLRQGALHIARVVDAAKAEGGGCPDGAPLQVRPQAEVPIAGVYDVAWAPSSAGDLGGEGDRQLLAIAGADGTLTLLSVCGGSGSGEAECEPAATPCQLAEGSILTHVAWGAGGPRGLAAVGQDGGAHHLELRPDGKLVTMARRQAHELEIWCVEVSPDSPDLVLSGADDGLLLGWDLRAPPDAAPAAANRKAHTAGVTALACSARRPMEVATGSYDERVRVFDLRALGGRPLKESERLGDGAYHLAWHSEWPGVLAVAAMRSGLPLLHAESSGSDLPEWGRYAADAPEGAHGSLAYGVAWRGALEPGAAGWLAASASFYDKSLHLWRVPCSAMPILASATG